MVFIETPVFTKRIATILSDDEYRSLQAELILQPDKGALIKGGKGLRKVRCQTKGKGKRGGARVIYYWFVNDQQIYMVFAYKKNEAENLTPSEVKILAQLVEEELHEKE